MQRRPALIVRRFDPATDAAGLRACLVELQEEERRIDPGMPPGEAMADAYLERMFARCRAWDGAVFVGAQGDELAGFVTVWARVPAGNAAARSLYRAAGFTEYEVILDKGLLERTSR
jgi:hypothetical protein